MHGWMQDKTKSVQQTSSTQSERAHKSAISNPWHVEKNCYKKLQGFGGFTSSRLKNQLQYIM